MLMCVSSFNNPLVRDTRLVPAGLGFLSGAEVNFRVVKGFDTVKKSTLSHEELLRGQRGQLDTLTGNGQVRQRFSVIESLLFDNSGKRPDEANIFENVASALKVRARLEEIAKEKVAQAAPAKIIIITFSY